jgi:anti-sigma B factor antagonist
MKTMTRNTAGVLVVALDGEMDTIDTDGLGHSLEQIAAESPKSVVLDFSGVSYIASCGIAMLIHFVQGIRRAGGQVRIASVTPRVQLVLDMVNLRTLVQFNATVEEAAAKLNG